MKVDSMAKIFISYRRQDTADATGRLCDRLKAQFGKDNIFLDVERIPYGADFRKRIGEEVGQCGILLAIIGEHWLNTYYEDGHPLQGQRRLDNPADWVRLEIEAALARDIPVIPVLVGQAKMPHERALPDSLHDFAYRQSAELRLGKSYESDASLLIQEIKLILKDRKPVNPISIDYKSLFARLQKFLADLHSRGKRVPVKKTGKQIKDSGTHFAGSLWKRVPIAAARDRIRAIGASFAEPFRSPVLRGLELPAWGLFTVGALSDICILIITLSGSTPGPLLCLPIFAFATASGFYMLKKQKYQFVRVGVIISLLTCFATPFAIWALILLRKPEIRASFENGGVLESASSNSALIRDSNPGKQYRMASRVRCMEESPQDSSRGHQDDSGLESLQGP